MTDTTTRCGAWYGTGRPYPYGSAQCIREKGHPPVSQDGIGHSDTPEAERLAALAEVGRLTLAAAAEPAVGLYLVYEMAQPTIRYVGTDNEYPYDLDQEADLDDVPEAFAAKAQEIVDRFDDMRCDSCERAIGYLLVEDEERPGQEWRTPWLIKGPSGGVGAVCEDCAPYDAPAPADAP